MLRILYGAAFLCFLVSCDRPRHSPTTPQVDNKKITNQKPPQRTLDKQLGENGPEAVKGLEVVLNAPDIIPAYTLFLASRVALAENRLEDAAFLYYSAQLRARFDKECFPPKGTGGDSPFIGIGLMSSLIGASLNPNVMREPKVYARAVDRVKNWTPKAPKDYNPGYEFTERKDAELAREATRKGREEFLEKMTGTAVLLGDPEYYVAFRIGQSYKLNIGDMRPTKDEYDKAVKVMERIEKEKGIQGFGFAIQSNPPS